MTAQIVSAVPVPFLHDGAIDLTEFDATLESLAPHVDAVLVAGTTGEFPALDDDERLELFRRAAAVLGPDRVIAHLGHGSLRQVLRLATGTAELGVSRFALLTPYYLPADEDGVVSWFRAVAEAYPAARVYAYLFPERTGIDVSASTLERVLALPGLAGVKVSGAATDRLDHLVAVLRPGQELYSGDDATLPRVLELGGHGVVSGVSAAFPETFAALAAALDDGDADASARLQATVATIVALVGTTIPRLKAALAARSGAPWAARMSMPAVDDDVLGAIREVVATHR